LSVGADDELFNADRFQPMLQASNPRIGVTAPIPGLISMLVIQQLSGDMAVYDRHANARIARLRIG